MDYLDPKKQRRHNITLMVGYMLIGIAIVIATIILVYQAYGFGLGKNGTVIQSGLFFFSSHPHPADIYANGKLQPVKTNTRLSLPSDIYKIVLKRDGYRDWQRTIGLDGGSVSHVDYPFLFPVTPATKKIHTYDSAPGFTTQSPDRRWLLVQAAGPLSAFEVYDLKNPEKAPEPLALPASLLTKSGGPESWQLVEWADDNRHVLLRHEYDAKAEFVLLDRSDPAESLNLNAALSVSPSRITLNNKKFDQYYLYDAASETIQKATSNAAQPPQAYLEHVLAYKSYGKNTMLYVTDSGAPAGKVLLKMQAGSKSHTLRLFPAGGTYLVDLTGYSGNLYVAASAVSENKVYIYKDPVGQLEAGHTKALGPAQVLHVTNPTYLSFSNSAQFIVAENGSEFGTYDIENKMAYHYTSDQEPDAPQEHATWMDGNRLVYMSGGKLVVFDYDNANRQTLVSASGSYLPAFDPDYKFVYTLAAEGSQASLTQTSLLTKADQ